MKELFFRLSFRLRKGSLLIAAPLMLICALQCAPPPPSAAPALSASEEASKKIKSGKQDASEKIESGKEEELQLELKSSRDQLRPGDCADLLLQAYNTSDHPIHWGANWVFEQEGPTPPLPEAAPRGALDIAPGETINLIGFRICHTPSARLAAGTYRYRISAERLHRQLISRSNWVTIQVLP